MAVVSLSLLYLGGLMGFICISGASFSDYQHPLIIKEGQSHLVTIETSLPEYQQASTTVHLVTLHEFESMSLTNGLRVDFNCNYTYLIESSSVLRAHFNHTELSGLDLDPAEDVDFIDISFNISFNSGVATFSLEIADDHFFENNESFIMYIDISKSQNETLGCAFLVKIQDNDGLSFSWSMPRIEVYEDEGTIRRLKILKHGTNEQSVILHVQVDVKNIPFEAINGIDYLLLQTTYIFDQNISSLSVPFEVYNDSIREVPENFHLNFTYQFRQNGDTVIPSNSSTTIYIIERVQFFTQPGNVSSHYGETIKIPCTSTSNTVPLWTITYSNGTVLQNLITSHLPEYITPTREGINVTVQDLRINLTRYSCSFHYFVPDPMSDAFRVKEVESHAGLLTINFPTVLFRLLSLSQFDIGIHDAYVREGETIFFRIIKQGGENYTFNATVHSTDTAIVSDDLLFEFQPITTEQNSSIKIPNDLSLGLEKFELEIAEINATGYGRIVGVDTGEPITVNLYDNYVIEFSPDEVRINQKSENKYYNICASITEPTVVGLDTAIQLLLPGFEQCLKVQVNEAVLNHTNQAVCFEVHYLANYTKCCRNFTLQPMVIPEGNSAVLLDPTSINITIEYDCHQTQFKDSLVNIIIVIVPSLIGFLSIIIVILSIVMCIFRVKRHNYKASTNYTDKSESLLSNSYKSQSNY